MSDHSTTHIQSTLNPEFYEETLSSLQQDGLTEYDIQEFFEYLEEEREEDIIEHWNTAIMPVEYDDDPYAFLPLNRGDENKYK